MASTVRSHKGLVTKKNQIVRAWLEESTQFLQNVQQTNTQHEHSKELALAVSMCDEYLQLLEVSLTKLTEAFDKLEDTTDEDEDKIDKYIESIEETIVGLHAHRSNLKRTLQEDNTGSSNQRSSSTGKPAITCTLCGGETEKEIWDRYWSLESTGTEEYAGTQQTELQRVNEKVLKRFKESIEKRDDGYYVRLPWKENHPDLPDNKALALKRLKKVLEIYQKDNEILQAYDNTFKDQLEKGVIEENTASTDDMTAEIRNNLYVDNLFFGAQSSHEALTKYVHTKNLFRELNMNLREYRSNDESFNETIEESDRMQSTCPKVLGIPWNSEMDKFVIKGSMGVAKERITKRTVTQQLASVYDPLGLLVPLLLPAKIFLQSFWKEELEWDTTLNPSLQDQWRQISTEISTFYKEVHRQILTTDKKTRLVVFTDAGQCAIAACAYLATEDESNLVMGKSKLPSIKTSMTIPKLEMNAVTLGVRMSHFICTELQSVCKIEEVIYYTDSDVVLGWIKSPPTRHSVGVLVTNRLTEIRHIIGNLEDRNIKCFFGHVKTSDNPADCESRGLTAEALSDHTWWKGPSFINKVDYATLTEIKKDEEAITATMNSIHISTERVNDQIIDLTRYSSLEKAQRVLVYALRFIGKSSIHFTEERKTEIQRNIPALKAMSRSQNITGAEMHESRMCIIRDHQKHYVDEHLIKSQKELNIREDEQGVLRCYGRLKKADISLTARTPIYIAPKTALSYLIITETKWHGFPGRDLPRKRAIGED
ncbi:unnamed protein product [Cylicocyclus nassatus]|uniref:Uncharacterized protein n=1 Tax=Cylicocyclus nassatus TaxID=53992 RepID=A0AA36MAG2_CYLNA|nr:unnamed protein product [Cylicocyclus nassatus]